MNPIYIEYYYHEKADCYKIDNPWTEYQKETMVLCKVSEGIDLAREKAKKVMAKYLEESFEV
jgi:hypothetical protein